MRAALRQPDDGAHGVTRPTILLHSMIVSIFNDVIGPVNGWSAKALAFAGVRSHPAQGGFGVLHTDGRRLLRAIRNGATLHPDAHHPARGQLLALLAELLRRAAHKPAAKEKHNRRTLISRLPIRRLLDKQFQLAYADFFVNQRFRGLCRHFCWDRGNFGR